MIGKEGYGCCTDGDLRCIVVIGVDMISKNRSRFSHGVVHSFTGGKDEMLKLVELGLYIGE